MSYRIHHIPIIKEMEDRPLTLSIFQNYQLHCFSSASATLQRLLIWGVAITEVWKVTTNEAKAEEVYTVLLACFNTLTKTLLLILRWCKLPFLQKDAPKC